MNIQLTELTDSQLTEVLENSGKGKAPVYRKPIREILEYIGDAQGSLSIPYAEINPAAKDRQTVVTGMKNALRTDAKNGKEFGRVAAVRANPDESLVTVVIRAA
jgi:hypothetical protein